MLVVVGPVGHQGVVDVWLPGARSVNFLEAFFRFQFHL